MDIEQVWKGLQVPTNDTLKVPAAGSSKHPLTQLKINLLVSCLFGISATALYVGVFIAYDLLLIRAALVVVLGFTVWVLGGAVALYRGLVSRPKQPAPLLEELEFHHKAITRWIVNQEKAGLFFYPVSATGGFLLGGFIGSGKPPEALLHETRILVLLAVIVVILTPACYLIVRRMSHIAFGKYLDQLQENIDALKSQNE